MPEIKLNIEAETDKQEAEFKDWEIEDAVRTLIRAEEIKQDVKLMNVIKPKLQEKALAAKKTLDAAEVLYGKEKNDESQSN